MGPGPKRTEGAKLEDPLQVHFNVRDRYTSRSQQLKAQIASLDRIFGLAGVHYIGIQVFPGKLWSGVYRPKDGIGVLREGFYPRDALSLPITVLGLGSETTKMLRKCGIWELRKLIGLFEPVLLRMLMPTAEPGVQLSEVDIEATQRRLNNLRSRLNSLNAPLQGRVLPDEEVRKILTSN